jgi:hypothetical protein
MRRLRNAARVYALAGAGHYWARDPATRAAFGEQPQVQMVMATMMVGPAALPDEVYEPESLARLLEAPR